MEKRIGVLDLQGDVREHCQQLLRLGVDPIKVRYPEDLAECAGLVIPGGESTTVGKLLDRHGLIEPVRQAVREGLALLGTCTGLILMAKDIVGSDQLRLGVMDLVVRRNAFGRQIDSFETDLPLPELGPEPFRAVFIRGPIIASTGPEVEVLARIPEGISPGQTGQVACLRVPPRTD